MWRKKSIIITRLVDTIRRNGTSITHQQGFISLAAKQSVGSLFSQKSAVLACESCEQIASSFISAMACWRLTAMGDECVFSGPACFRVVVWARCKALWEPRLHFADTQACAFMPRPIKWPCQAAISWDSLLQYRGIKAFYEAFSQPKVCAIAACMPFSSTRVDLTSLDA